MNKTELIDQAAARAQATKAETTRITDAIIETITEALEKGLDVNIANFGTFKVSALAARPGRNPQTGQPITIAARKAPRFTAGKRLKDACNGKKS